MHLAYVSLDGRGATDALLTAAVARLRDQRITLAGTVQTNPPCAGRTKCDMDIHVLPDGPTLRISQDLGAHARGCRLDSSALETAVAEAARRLDGAAALVVNKFGKQEAEGRGFVPVIAAALDREIPVLVGVNALNLQPFNDFAGDLATRLPPDPDAIAAWVLESIAVHAA
ncbi:DUF2478 domain-containing protein [Pararhodobacter sp. SW119]|uniref:DUF2478 domain-containing protein n=1 Tax=Pararhodobacter sp. SW119 TaxID=2780075 RepID=UPI001ADF57D7|nr:DUF2478 domain-containing protein [Pararhodobacter sp. SW119]